LKETKAEAGKVALNQRLTAVQAELDQLTQAIAHRDIE
jgi:hypothetical protein